MYNVRATNQEKTSSSHESASDCANENEILDLLRAAALAKSEEEVPHERDLLIKEAKRSSNCRNRVVKVTMNAMDQPNLHFTRDPNLFNLWTVGAELLGDLKGSEAVDLLISQMRADNGAFSTSMSDHPALSGLIKMGSIAIPKLSDAMEHGNDPDVRRFAAYCIAGIGGTEAKKALERALPSESDPCVKRFIRVSIDTVDVERGGLKHDTVEWFVAFQCLQS